MKKFDINNYNQASKKFFNDWLKDCKVIGCKSSRGSRTDEDLIFYYDADNKIRIAVMNIKGSANNGTCFYGDLQHYAKVLYCHVFGWKFENICYWYDYKNMQRIEKAINNYLGL